jgi:hypothetical protein
MSEETAKLLIEATNRLATALERVSGGLGAAGVGVHIYHHNVPPIGQQPCTHPYQPYVPGPWISTWGYNNTGE